MQRWLPSAWPPLLSTKTPVIYAAISDPAAADLTDIDYVTGTSDALNTQSIMDMMFAVQPDIQTVGLLYSNSEANSTTPIAEAKAYLDAKGIAYVEKTGNTNDEIMTAASSMVGQVDAVFTPTDNVVMAAAACLRDTDQGRHPILYRCGQLRHGWRVRHLRRQLHRAWHLHRRHGPRYPRDRHRA